MTRDDSSGGWLAQDGCLSRVGVCRLLPRELLGKDTFLIHGERLKDRQVGVASELGVSVGGRSWEHLSMFGLSISGDSGMFPKERSGLYKGHAHIPPLEGGQQEVWPDVPESSRCQSLRPGSEEGAGGPDGRSESFTVSMLGRGRVQHLEPPEWACLASGPNSCGAECIYSVNLVWSLMLFQHSHIKG